MTCIVAIEQNGKVWMGGDSAASRDDDVVCRINEKVFFNGEFIIGFSGSFRVGQLLQYAFNPPKQNPKQSDMAYMVIDFIDCLRKLLNDKGAITKKEEGDSHDSEFIVGYKGKIYVVESDFNIGKPITNYSSTGSGQPYAMGALYAQSETMMDPESRIIQALNAAVEYCTTVKSPFTILCQ